MSKVCVKAKNCFDLSLKSKYCHMNLDYPGLVVSPMPRNA